MVEPTFFSSSPQILAGLWIHDVHEFGTAFFSANAFLHVLAPSFPLPCTPFMFTAVFGLDAVC